MTDNKHLIQDAFRHLFETPGYDENIIRQYFSTDYVQHVDGKTLHFSDFMTHIKLLKETVPAMSVSFTTLAQEGNIVFSNHTVAATTIEGRSGVVQVIAEFHTSNNKIIYCSELTRQLSGDPQDRDLGSRH